jgi:hypothetical protein
MNLLPALADWITLRKPMFPYLSRVSIVKMGDDNDLLPPFLALMETGSSEHETNGVIMRGVSDVELSCELHTVPTSEEQSGTTAAIERKMREELYDILGDMEAIDWMSERCGVRVFDIRIPSPTTEASDGRRISRWNLQIVACPT